LGSSHWQLAATAAQFSGACWQLPRIKPVMHLPWGSEQPDIPTNSPTAQNVQNT
jgi:hypothetical protein